MPTFKSLTPIPVILHICKISRKKGLEIHRTVFKAMGKNGTERGEIYFNYQRDFLCVQVPKYTLPWKLYTGGHPHSVEALVVSPFRNPRINIFRAQSMRNIMGNDNSEIVVGIGPTPLFLPVLPNSQYTQFKALQTTLGKEWDLVEYYIWKAEWWYEHCKYLGNHCLSH